MLGAIARYPARYDLASLRNESAKHSIFLVIDEGGFALAKPAYFSSTSFHLFFPFYDLFIATSRILSLHYQPFDPYLTRNS
jgi:hypothetical protein